MLHVASFLNINNLKFTLDLDLPALFGWGMPRCKARVGVSDFFLGWLNNVYVCQNDAFNLILKRRFDRQPQEDK